MYPLNHYTQTTASEATYYSLLAARTATFSKYDVAELDKYAEKSEINGRLVCYCSDQAHSSVEKAALVSLVRVRLLPTDGKLSLQGDVLRKAIEQDIKAGLIPFWVCATLGTTGACGFDNLKEIGEVCKEKVSFMMCKYILVLLNLVSSMLANNLTLPTILFVIRNLHDRFLSKKASLKGQQPEKGMSCQRSTRPCGSIYSKFMTPI